MTMLPIVDCDGRQLSVDVTRVLSVMCLDVDRTAITMDSRTVYVPETARVVLARISALRNSDHAKASALKV